MSSRDTTLKLLKSQALLPLFYHDSDLISIQIVKAIYKGGGRLIEYTNRGSNALKNFSTLRKLVNDELPGMELGVGTIRTLKDAESFVDAGADFVVCPVINKEIANLIHQHRLLWIPGCITPTEIDAAEQAGASLVKIFPGNLLGPSYLLAIKEIFPDLLFMPTGGVEPTIENLKSWFEAGVFAVGLGSKLINHECIIAEQYELLEKRTHDLLALINTIKLSGNV
ncbi:MAG: bifunctional 4-hydroxy-2-oxoglutarate aldolase/2-dehydro-3-deoxy-phosphogluconate aldolase [Flavobacterium sp.]|nr:bifunctional 4-hydroxy-2-oxoglutarate aldolase/2-dehydro-3-deoxy-phosphogluconate aldolase [Pedobacter sp.]